MNDNKPNKPKNADGTKNAEGTSPSKPHSVFFDEDGNAITSADAASRPIVRLGEDSTIILGPRPPAVAVTTPLCAADGTRIAYDTPPHQLPGHTPKAPASDGQTSSQSVGYDDLRIIINEMHRNQAELQRAQVDPPKLPMLSSSCASQLGVVRHLHDLQRYFVEYDSRSPDGTPSAPQWRVAQANKSIAKVDKYHYWSIVIGAACVSWEAWRDEFKKQALSPNWESETRRVFEGLQCQGSTLTAWQTFEKKAGECQIILGNCLGGITDL